MKRAFALFLLVSSLAAPAVAQTEGRISVGGSVTFAKPTDEGVQSLVGVGPLVRLNPKKGWGPAGGFSWFSADLDNPSGAGGPFASLRVKPLMGGVAYTIGEQPFLVSFSIVAGPSFNRLKLDSDFVNSLPASAPRPTVDASTSFAVRPGVGLTYTVAPRVALIGFGGYMVNRPDVTYRDSSGQEFRNRWKADALLLSVGAVYSLF
jgi:outer membrane protein with beta-barrel domain